MPRSGLLSRPRGAGGHRDPLRPSAIARRPACRSGWQTIASNAGLLADLDAGGGPGNAPAVESWCAAAIDRRYVLHPDRRGTLRRRTLPRRAADRGRWRLAPVSVARDPVRLVR